MQCLPLQGMVVTKKTYLELLLHENDLFTRVNIGLFCSTPAVAVSRAVPHKIAMEMLFTGQPIFAKGIFKHSFTV